MSGPEMRPSGLSAVGDLSWGAHFCEFFDDRADLVDTLVPYFKAGLESRDKCLWITCEPLRADDAKTALRAALPDVDQRIRSGQLQIIDSEEWYLRTGKPDAQTTLRGWLEREQHALESGYAGLRLTGNTVWVDRASWADFMDYESQVTKTFAGHRIVGMCTYCLGTCQAHDILDVVANHQFALTRRRGEWELLESAPLKVAKQELHRANQELEARVEERTAELRMAVAARDEFLSVAAHELRTPITSLQLYAEGTARAHESGTLSPQQLGERLHRVRAQCGRLDRLINNLLDVSGAGHRGMPLEPEPVDLAELVRETAATFAEDLARAGCAFTLDAPAAVLGAWDRARLEQVFANLLQNATRYAAGSSVTVRVHRQGERAVVSVSDTGPGIPAEEHLRIFDRFVQASGPRGVAGGFGLGLWVVKEVVHAHGGSIHLESAPGRGATFTLALPISGSGD